MPLLVEGLVAETVLSERKLIAMHRDHPLAGRRSVRSSDLLAEPIAAPWEIYPPELIDYWLGLFRPQGRMPVDPHTVTVEESLALVAGNRALYCVPESVSRFYSHPDVVFRPVTDAPPAEVAIAWTTEVVNPAVTSFVETARAVLAEGGGEVAEIQSGRS
jgi:DNA-binding transcriptional LysR family regulator